MLKMGFSEAKSLRGISLTDKHNQFDLFCLSEKLEL